MNDLEKSEEERRDDKVLVTVDSLLNVYIAALWIAVILWLGNWLMNKWSGTKRIEFDNLWRISGIAVVIGLLVWYIAIVIKRARRNKND